MMEGIVTAIIIIVSVIGWISNAVNENKKPGKPQGERKRQPQQKRKLQNELEDFLQDLQGEKKQKPQRPARQPQRQTERQQEPQRKPRLVEKQERKRRPQRKRISEKSQPLQSRRQERKEPESVFKNDADRHVGSGNLGQNLKKHVEEYIGSHHAGTLRQELAEELSTKQPAALSRRPMVRSNVSISTAGNKAIDLLVSADSVQTAIVLNEILQPPISQRPNRY